MRAKIESQATTSQEEAQQTTALIELLYRKHGWPPAAKAGAGGLV
jgi:hypothetical protein